MKRARFVDPAVTEVGRARVVVITGLLHLVITKPFGRALSPQAPVITQAVRIGGTGDTTVHIAAPTALRVDSSLAAQRVVSVPVQTHKDGAWIAIITV